jgi:hypothetical protein
MTITIDLTPARAQVTLRRFNESEILGILPAERARRF